jgi:hypothetical protein
MNLRHYAGLTLIAWYLMLPPPDMIGRRLSYEPLPDWRLLDEFDSERECRQTRAKLIEQMPLTEIDTARCVPSNDPRLVPSEKPNDVGALSNSSRHAQIISRLKRSFA